MAKNTPEYIIVHTSVSAWGTVEDIREWHLERGFRDVGYHYVIENGYPNAADRRAKKRDPKRDGLLTVGRSEGEEGAHTPGYNTKSLGICLIGDVTKEFYTDMQMRTLIVVLSVKCRQYGIDPKNVIGHYETPNGKKQDKTCPDLDMDEIRAQVAAQMAKWEWVKHK